MKRFNSIVTGLTIFCFTALFQGVPAQGAKTDPGVTDKAGVVGKTLSVQYGRVFQKPDADSKVLFEVDKPVDLTVIYKEGEWYSVKLPDERLGWVHESMLPLTGGVPAQTAAAEPAAAPAAAAAPEKVEKRVALKVDSGRVREGPSISADLMFGLQRGDTVDVLGEEGSWYHIRREDGKIGWAHKSLFRPADEAAEAAESDAAEPEAAEDAPAPMSEKDIVLKEIRHDRVEDGKEAVYFVLNGFFTPQTFVLEEDIPKLVCDFENVTPDTALPPEMDIDSDLITKIRSGLHKGSPPKLRVVLDLIPDTNYNVEQVFYKKGNIYALIIGVNAPDAASGDEPASDADAASEPDGDAAPDADTPEPEADAGADAGE